MSIKNIQPVPTIPSKKRITLAEFAEKAQGVRQGESIEFFLIKLPQEDKLEAFRRKLDADRRTIVDFTTNPHSKSIRVTVWR